MLRVGGGDAQNKKEEEIRHLLITYHRRRPLEIPPI